MSFCWYCKSEKYITHENRIFVSSCASEMIEKRQREKFNATKSFECLIKTQNNATYLAFSMF